MRLQRRRVWKENPADLRGMRCHDLKGVTEEKKHKRAKDKDPEGAPSISEDLNREHRKKPDQKTDAAEGKE